MNSVFSHGDVEGFEQVLYSYDKETGLKSIVSVHNTRLGPSMGGCRFFPYADEAAALQDALNLARAMSYKAAVAGLNLGGGKAVIIGDPSTGKTPALWKAYARGVDRLGGSYITTVDSGTSPADMDQIRKHTKYVAGMTEASGGSGDPSPTTALGVAEGIRASVKFVFGSDTVSGKRVAIQGVGHVGYPLAKILKQMGASLVISDKNPENAKRAMRDFGAEVVDAKDVFGVKCDVFAPCALGDAINDETVTQLKCAIVAGAANNPLQSRAIADSLQKRGVVYAPDFVINAGGLIHVGSEWTGFNAKTVEEKTRNIYNTILMILKRAQDQKCSPARVAIELGDERIRKA